MIIEDNDGKNNSRYETPTCNCPCECGGNQGKATPDPATGNTNASFKSALGGGNSRVSYNSQGNRNPLIGGVKRFTSNAANANYIEAKPVFGGVVGDSVFYDPEDVIANEDFQFTFAADTDTLPTGHYPWYIEIIEHHSGGDVYDIIAGQRTILRDEYPEFGGWAPNGLQRLAIQTGGATLVETAIGNAFWFRKDSSGDFHRQDGEVNHSTLVELVGGEYELTTKDGTVSTFSEDGLLLTKTDRLGRTTTYSYTDADGDTVVDELEEISDWMGHTLTFAYDMSGFLESVTNENSIASLITIDSGRLVEVENPDPDGGGPLTAETIEFTYTAGGLLLTMTDDDSEVTEFTYDVHGLANSVTYPDSETEEFTPAFAYGLVDTSGGVGASSTNLAPLYPADEAGGTSIDALGNETTVLTNRFGQPLQIIDDAGNITTFVRDADGRVIERTDPDPDGEGSLTAPVTTYEYDSAGNLIEITHPDETTEVWTYDATFNVPLTYIDRREALTVYTINSTTGLVTSERRVVGEIDDEINEETDDVVNSYTYTPDPTTSGDPPAGLLASMTDPLGRVTEYEYDEYGNLLLVTFAVGTALEASVSYEYDANQRLESTTDELGRVTTYAYDAYGRLTTTTLPDPDAGGPLASPVITTLYDNLGRVSKEIDPLGRETVYHYDARGNLTQIDRPDHDSDTNLTITEFAFNAGDQQTSATDPLGRVISYQYNYRGQVTQVTQPDPDAGGPLAAPVTSTTYDNLGRVLTQTDALGNVTSYAYANFGREITVTLPDPDGGGALASPVLVSVYDAGGNLISQTDALENETVHAYDILGRLISVTQPDPGSGAPVTTYECDKAGNLRFVTDPLGNVTEYQYDARNRRIKVIQEDPDGGGAQSAPETDYEYDDAGQLVSMTDALGYETVYAYDALGRQTSVTLPDPDGGGSQSSPVISYTYDAAGRLLTSTDPLGKVTTFAYDLLDNQISVTLPDPDGGGSLTSPVTSYTFDDAGQLLTVTDPLSRVTTYAYDNLGRQTSVTLPDPDGGGSLAAPVTTYAYNAAGLVTSITDPRSQTTTYAYDNLHRRISVTDPESGVTSFTYDASGRMLTLTDPVENTTTWIYDELGRVTSETNQLSEVRTFAYDLVGNLVEKIDRLSRKTQYVYDDLHRRIEENWLDSGDATIRTFAHTYDALGRLTALDETIDSSPGTNYAYSYDGLGRLTTETQSLIGLAIDITYESTFDANGRRTKLLSELGAYNDFDNRYHYDNLGRLTSVDQRQRTSGTSTVIAPKRFDFAYNAASQLSQVTRYADLSGFEFVANQFNQYDGIGRLTRLLHTTDSTAPGSGWGSGALAGYDYAYDAATRLTEIDSFVDGLTEYTHDNTSQLTAADHTGQTDENYAYDENGNRTGGGYVTGDNNQTTEDGVYTYTYDAEGNRLTRTRVSDGYVTAYEWDHRNRLVSITELDDLEEVLSETSHDYDAFNQWIRRTVDSVETIFSHHDGQIVYQFDGDTAADLTNRYLWNPATIDQLLVDEVVADLSTAGDLQFPMGDHLGTVRDIAEYNAGTDTTSIANHIRYNSFGKVVSETNSAIDLLFGFTSRPLDDSTGLQNNLNRWYDRFLGQWASEDPIGFAAGDLNVRRYVSNSPLRATDPSGLQIVFEGAAADVNVVNSILEELKMMSEAASKFVEDMESSKTIYKIVVVRNDANVLGGNFFEMNGHTIDIGDIEKFPRSGVASQAEILFHELRELYILGKRPANKATFWPCHQQASLDAWDILGSRPRAEVPEFGINSDPKCPAGEKQFLDATYVTRDENNKTIFVTIRTFYVPRDRMPASRYSGDITRVEVIERAK